MGIGGEKGDRTLDLRLMSPALYQLSYLAKDSITETTVVYDTKFSQSRQLCTPAQNARRKTSRTAERAILV